MTRILTLLAFMVLAVPALADGDHIDIGNIGPSECLSFWTSDKETQHNAIAACVNLKGNHPAEKAWCKTFIGDLKKKYTEQKVKCEEASVKYRESLNLKMIHNQMDKK